MMQLQDLRAFLRRARHLANNYGWSRLTGKPSLRGFWYTPDKPAVFDQPSLEAYRSAWHPPYLIDYRPKLAYSLVNSEGIVVLPYDDPIGNQVNPEAAFQYALGLHDEHLATGEAARIHQFIHYADYFADRQTPAGDWRYGFDWYGSRAGWTSALAQSRGASVMLRAARITRDDSYLARSRLALARFETPVSAGGYLATMEVGGRTVQYLEEYPQEPTAVLNGFIAGLFALFEVGLWLDDEGSTRQFSARLDDLEAILPLYSHGDWSLYSLDQRRGWLNYDSPHYHALTTNYLAVIAAIDPVLSGRFQAALTTWREQQTTLNVVRYALAKMIYKLAVR